MLSSLRYYRPEVEVCLQGTARAMLSFFARDDTIDLIV